MILYFSGTDNSKHVAERLGDPRIVDIKEALKKKRCGFTLLPGESVGIICPVYYSSLPKTVLEFLRHMKLKGEITYLYGVLTHGGGPGGAGGILERELKKKGYPLHACFEVFMSSNYLMAGGLRSSEEKETERLINAEPVIDEIKDLVDNQMPVDPYWNKLSYLASLSMYPIADRYMSVKKFYSDESCVGCGVCASRCPSGLIKMVDGKPEWTENKCVRCMACLRCNAVQYGKMLKGKRRYHFRNVANESLENEMCH